LLGALTGKKKSNRFRHFRKLPVPVVSVSGILVTFAADSLRSSLFVLRISSIGGGAGH
jgi:hypothetical protein